MIDDSAVAKSRRREMSARQRAEEAMAARDAAARQRPAADGGGRSRGPVALQLVKANRSSSLELERLGASLKCPASVVAKAEGFLRKAYTGVHCLGRDGQMACLPAACLEIAARVCKKPINRDALLKQAGVSERDRPNFSRALSHCYCLLGVRRELSVADLCAEFKCNAIKASVRQALETFKLQFWASLPEDRRPDADFSRPVFAVAAFYMTAEKHKHVVKPPPKSELLRAGDVQEDDFKRILELMKKFAQDARVKAAGKAQQSAMAKAAAANAAAGSVAAASLREQLPTAASATEAVATHACISEMQSEASSCTSGAGQMLGSLESSSEQQAAAESAPAFGALACMLKAERSRRETAQECDAGQKQELVPSRKLSRDMAEELQADCRGGPDARAHSLQTTALDGGAAGISRGDEAVAGAACLSTNGREQTTDSKGYAEPKSVSIDKAHGVCNNHLMCGAGGGSATPVCGHLTGKADLEAALCSGQNTVRKVEMRRPMPSAAQRLSNLCSLGVKRKQPVSATSLTPVSSTQRAGSSKSLEAHDPGWAVVAGDGMPAVSAKERKRQRKEAEAAEKARQNELRAREYATWRAAQLAECQRVKSQATLHRLSSGAAAENAADSGPVAAVDADGIPPIAASLGAAMSSNPVAAAAPPKQVSLLAFIRPKPPSHPLPDANETAPCSVADDTSPRESVCEEDEGAGKSFQMAVTRERLALAAEARVLAAADAATI